MRLGGSWGSFLWAEAKRGQADLVAALAWKVPPSNHSTKEFSKLRELISHELSLAPFCFSFAEDKKELKDFIKVHFDTQRLTKSKIQINKNNFLGIYKRWLRLVKDSIAVDWDEYRRVGILDGDFYLADLLSTDTNEGIKERLEIVLKKPTNTTSSKKKK